MFLECWYLSIFKKHLIVLNGFSFGCLEAFNFGPDLSRWVKTFYENIQSCIINNGNVSDYFFLGRGVRQGDPLSPYLFVLAAEALTIAVRQNVDIKGIFADGQETKLPQYADDMTAVLSDITSTQALFNLLDSFRISSGLSIYWSKLKWKVCGLGLLDPIKQNHLVLTGPMSQLKHLGSFIRMIKSSFMRRTF